LNRTPCAGAGGAIYIACTEVGDACTAMLSRKLGIPSIAGAAAQIPKIVDSSNIASAYGAFMAAYPKNIGFVVQNGLLQRQFVPGVESLTFIVILHDALGNQVKGSDFVYRSRVCIHPISDCSDVNSIVTPGFHEMDAAGQCLISRQQVPCPMSSGAVNLQVSLVSFDGALVSTAPIACLPCRLGQSRVENEERTLWHCKACQENQYVLDPNNASFSCQICPIGAICDGNSLKGKVEGSVWKPDFSSGQYKLISCPYGYEKSAFQGVDVSYAYMNQQCSACASNQFILYSSSNVYTCQNCPVGAVCNGTALSGLVPGSAWFPDFTSGQYVLRSCPMGYQAIGTGPRDLAISYSNQQCAMCDPGQYCIGGSASSTACPAGTFSRPGANASKSCYSVIFVQIDILLITTMSYFQPIKSKFVSCMADSLRVDKDNFIVYSVIPQVYRRTSGENAVNVILRVAVLSASSASMVSQIARSLDLNKILMQNGLPQGQMLSVTILSQILEPNNSTLILALSLVIGLMSIVGIAMIYSFMNSKTEDLEARNLRLKIAEIRSRLRIQRRDGYILQNEHVPLFANMKSKVFINKSYIEAAAKIELHQDFDVLHFDALCNCLEFEGGPAARLDIIAGVSSPQYDALCTWLLEVCRDLINPSYEAPVNECRDGRAQTSRERFSFVLKICKAQIWKSGDGVLFQRLKDIARMFMEVIADKCDERYDAMVREPGGVDLIALRSWPLPDEESHGFCTAKR
jgi:hypothetical protein